MGKIISLPKNYNKKRFYIIVAFSLFFILLIILFSLYIGNIKFRNFVDTNILKKNINNENSKVINFEDNESNKVFAYDKYICLLNRSTFSTYNSSGEKVFDLNVTLTDPIYSNSNRFIALAEKEGQKIYLIENENIAWQKDIEGNINRIFVNKNGYVSVVVTGTSYKSVVITFNNSGKELFKTYLSNTIASDIAISNDNKYLAIAELDYSGTSIQSNIKILSIEKSQKDPTNAFDYIYPASSNSIINNIKYNSKNRLICLYNDCIHLIENNSDRKLYDLSKKNDLFVDINLTDTYLVISEDNSNLFSNLNANLFDISSDKKNIYELDSSPKSIFCQNDVIAIVSGTRINFINSSGWLIKNYSSTNEPTDIKIATGIAGIIYKDRIEIINF